MEVENAIKTRRSVRSYLQNPVPEAALRKVLEAGRLAPSASNRQPWCFIVVEEQPLRAAIGSTGRFASFLAESPLVIVGCGDTKTSPKWHAVDVSIAMENMVIAATAEGLGTCWIGSFDEAKVKGLLKIPENYAIIALLALGYPKEQHLAPTPPNRKRLGDIAMRGEFGRPFE